MSERPAPPPLEPVDESWERALCIVAHPDDIEYGAAAAVARWTGQGKWVGYTMVTSGEAGIDGMDPDEAGACARPRRSRPPGIVGVDTVDFLGLPDGVLEYGVALRRAIAAEVRRHRPEIVITGNFRDTSAGKNLNQADHIAVGKAVLDAVRDAGNRWVFREQLERTAWSRGAASRRCGPRLPRRHPRSRHHRHLRRRRRVAEGTPGLHRRPRLGELGRGRVPRGIRPHHRPAPRRRVRDTFEVFPMGWGD